MLKTIFFALFAFVLIVLLGFLLNRPKIGSSGKFVDIEIREKVFRSEIADTIATRSRGLSGRETLADDRAMFFIFPFAGPQSFWMRGMKFSLDILWINGERIVGIDKNVPVPTGLELAIYSPPGPVDRVLEINAGLADKFGFRVGDMISLVGAITTN